MSQDGRTIICCGSDKNKGKVITILKKQEEYKWLKSTKETDSKWGIRSVAINSDGNMMLGHEKNGKITHTSLQEIETDAVACQGHSSAVTSLA